MNHSLLLLAAASCVALSGCVAPAMAPYPVDVTAEPGATVTYLDQKCTAPCRLDVRDQFGFYSKYMFTVTKDGKSKTTVIEETSWMHANGVVPQKLKLDLGQ